MKGFVLMSGSCASGGRFAGVMTSTTRGCLFAAATSRNATRPRAMLLTARTAKSIPGGWLSAAKRARPVTFKTPSRRVSGWPMFEPCRRCAGAWLSAISDMLQNSGRKGEGGGRKRRHALGSSRRCQHQRPHHDSTRQHDLVSIVAGRFRILERSLGRAAKCGAVRSRASEHSLGRAGPPRLQCNATERDPRLDDRAAFDPQGGGRGYDREGIGGALANLEVAGMRREGGGLSGQTDGDDQLARFEHAVALGRISGQTVETLERNLAA